MLDFNTVSTLVCALMLYPGRNATELMQVVDFTVLMRVCHQVSSSLLASSNYIKSVTIRLDAT